MFALIGAFLLAASSANAQTNLVFDTAGNIIGNYVGPRSIIADWVYSGGASGVSGSSVGKAIVPTVAGDVAVPVTASTSYTAGRIAGIATKVARLAGPIGTAFTAYQIYNAIKDSGLSVCPPPDFFCVPSPSDTTSPVAQSGWSDVSNGYPGPYGSAQQICDAAFANRYPKPNDGYLLAKQMPTQYAADGKHATCYAQRFYVSNGQPYDPIPFVIAAPSSAQPATCPDGYAMSGTVCVKNNPTLIPATDAQITQKVTDKQASDSAYGKRVLDALRADQKANPAVIPASTVVPPDLPITISSSPATSPEVEVGRKTIQNADGTTSTEVTKQQTTVTPQTSGTTVQDSKTVYDIKTITNIYNTNNTTNVTTTTTTTTTTPGTSPTTQPAPAEDKGPKECGSPGKPPCKIDETGTPTTVPTANADSQIQKEQTTRTGMDTTISGITEDKVGWNWFPQIPTADCQNPMVPNPITGASVPVNICDAFNIFKSFISAVIVFFIVVASVREVQAAIKA